MTPECLDSYFWLLFNICFVGSSSPIFPLNVGTYKVLSLISLSFWFVSSAWSALPQWPATVLALPVPVPPSFSKSRLICFGGANKISTTLRIRDSGVVANV